MRFALPVLAGAFSVTLLANAGRADNDAACGQVLCLADEAMGTGGPVAQIISKPIFQFRCSIAVSSRRAIRCRRGEIFSMSIPACPVASAHL
jgi:hypothetical protein